MRHEVRFGAAMNWLMTQVRQGADFEVLSAIRHALQLQADNAEGIAILPLVANTFALLPSQCGVNLIWNYIDQFLAGTRFEHGRALLHGPSLETFQHLWGTSFSILEGYLPATVSVLEPACGSANDYRFFHTYGLARFIHYSGFDLCAKNVENAKAMFPSARFELGNVFSIPAKDQSYDLCIVQDLFEHLSLEGLHCAVKEVCRVTRQALCVGFFQMDEIADHVVRPIDDYYWNLLSMLRLRELFASHGFSAQVIHIGTYLREVIGCNQTHNPNAYTFLLCRNTGSLS